MAADETGRVWDLIKKISICMFATGDGERIRARPMAAAAATGSRQALGDKRKVAM